MTNSPEFPDSSVVKECLTTHLVMRLRSENSMPPYYGVPKLQVEAADEIERLRAALQEVKPLVLGANHSETRYPKACAALAAQPAPSESHLAPDHQAAMHGALRRSVSVVQPAPGKEEA